MATPSYDPLPPIGSYWTEGALLTDGHMREGYATCARCGSIVNSKDRHEAWHARVEGDNRKER